MKAQIADQVVEPDDGLLIPCRDAWIHNNVNRRGADLAFVQIKGEAGLNFAGLQRNDIVVIDRSRTQGIDGVYVIAFSSPATTTVRRLRWLLSGKVLDLTTGETFDPAEVAGTASILGMVAWPRVP